MAVVAFTKVEGLGNDFVLLDRTQLDRTQLDAEIRWAQTHARALCDRRTGIGADGILLVGPAGGDTVASMTVVNFDGSRPEMCGNGLRCVAAFVAEKRGETRVRIDTDAGPKLCEVVGTGTQVSVRIDMGASRVLPEATPVASQGRRLLGISMGNPHAIHFVGDDEQPEPLARTLGPGIEIDPVYAPHKTNVEFARVRASTEPTPAIELWVWERGVGITQACGTGACATAVAAAQVGLVPHDVPIAVDLPGGRLLITAPSDPSAGVIMVGPCRQVFVGEFESPASASDS